MQLRLCINAAQAAALEKRRAGEGRDVEHVALQTPASEQLQAGQRPRRAKTGSRAASAAAGAAAAGARGGGESAARASAPGPEAAAAPADEGAGMEDGAAVLKDEGGEEGRAGFRSQVRRGVKGRAAGAAAPAAAAAAGDQSGLLRLRKRRRAAAAAAPEGGKRRAGA